MFLVTSGSDTIARVAISALKAAGAPVRVAARDALDVFGGGVEVVALDWDDPATYAPALAGVTSAFIVTPMHERADQWEKRLVEAAQAAGGVGHLVKLSLLGADIEPGITLGRQHRAAEQAIEASGIPFTFLRSTLLMQDFKERFGVSPTEGGKVIQAFDDQAVAWVDARDVGAVAAKVLVEGPVAHGGKVYTLTGPEALTTEDAVKLLDQAIAPGVTYVAVSEGQAGDALRAAGWPEWEVTALVELAHVVNQGWAAHTTDHVQGLLGRPPRTFAAWVEDLVRGQA